MTTRTADVITDFTQGDVIDLTAINVPFNAVDGSFAFSGLNSDVVANSITWYENSGDTIVQLYNTGDTNAG
jgi:hypothetical protein